MNELIVKIKYSDTACAFSAFDVQKAMEHLFGINTDFKVEEFVDLNTSKNQCKENRSAKLVNNSHLCKTR